MREKDDEPCTLIFSRTTEYYKEEKQQRNTVCA